MISNHGVLWKPPKKIPPAGSQALSASAQKGHAVHDTIIPRQPAHDTPKESMGGGPGLSLVPLGGGGGAEERGEFPQSPSEMLSHCRTTHLSRQHGEESARPIGFFFALEAIRAARRLREVIPALRSGCQMLLAPRKAYRQEGSNRRWLPGCDIVTMPGDGLDQVTGTQLGASRGLSNKSWASLGPVLDHCA